MARRLHPTVKLFECGKCRLGEPHDDSWHVDPPCQRESVTPTDGGRLIVDCSTHGEIGSVDVPGATIDKCVAGEGELVEQLWAQHITEAEAVARVAAIAAGPTAAIYLSRQDHDAVRLVLELARQQLAAQ